MPLFTNFRLGPYGAPSQMLVENGRIVQVQPSLVPFGGPSIDLGGGWVLPGFIDAHCHILPTGLNLRHVDLSATATKEAVLEALLERHRQNPEGWLLAVMYDQNRFPDAEHLTSAELDGVSSDRPILVRHSNGHASVANSAALAAAGVDDATPDPPAGEFGRDASGRLNGLLLEDAHERVWRSVPPPSFDEMVEAILAAGERMSALGITCASDMMTGERGLEQEIAAYRTAAERGCKIRTRLYLLWGAVLGPKAAEAPELQELLSSLQHDRCDVAGVKIFADGAIASATAAIYGRFVRGSAPADATEDGKLMYKPERLIEMVRIADDAGYHVAIHSIGDRSTDLVMDAYAQTQDPRRHRIEHAMILSDAQIERMAKLGCHCAMQPEFLMRLGTAYKKQLGPERASGLKRFRSALSAGIPLSLNSDRPVVPGDPWDGVLSACDRPEGFDPSENLTRAEALFGYTKMGAVANNDPDMGSIYDGMLADFQVYAASPYEGARQRPSAVYLGGTRLSN